MGKPSPVGLNPCNIRIVFPTVADTPSLDQIYMTLG